MKTFDTLVCTAKSSLERARDLITTCARTVAATSRLWSSPNRLAELKSSSIQSDARRQTMGAGVIPSNPTFALRGKVAQLRAQSERIGRRNRYLFVGLLGGVSLLLLILCGMYQAAVRSYAVLEGLKITQDPASQGRLQISFRVVSPGKVFYRRSSGNIETEVVDYFATSGEIPRYWSWVYDPGKNIDVSVRYRHGLWRRSIMQSLPTAKRADIVVLMDTTGSMGRYINMLREKCVDFSTQLKNKDIEHRFAFLGFGDTNEGEWLDKHPFTDNVDEFKQYVAGVKRFDGGDFPESSLDAIEEALKLPFAEDSIRRVYLVTDDTYHEPTHSGAQLTDIASRLEENRIVLNVFTTSEFFADYERLSSGSNNRERTDIIGNVKVQGIESFGAVLSEGRVLED